MGQTLKDVLFLLTFHWSDLSHIATLNCKHTGISDLIPYSGKGNEIWRTSEMLYSVSVALEMLGVHFPLLFL